MITDNDLHNYSVLFDIFGGFDNIWLCLRNMISELVMHYSFWVYYEALHFFMINATFQGYEIGLRVYTTARLQFILF